MFVKKIYKTFLLNRRNPWGNMSYADLITQAIKSSTDQRLTLAQVNSHFNHIVMKKLVHL